MIIMIFQCIKKYVKIVFLLIIVFIGAYKWMNRKVVPEFIADVPHVVIQQPTSVKMAEYIHQTGSLSAFKSVDLVARVEGYLQEISFIDGSFVEKGKPLFLIEPEPYKEKLNEAKASVTAAIASLDYAKAEYARQKSMYRQNATSQNSVEMWLAKVQKAQAELSQSKSNVINAEINLSYTKVSAPFDGRIGRHLIDIGNLVGNGLATELATIEQTNPIYVYFNLNELDLLKFKALARKKGLTKKDISTMTVEIGLQNEAGYPHNGKLDFVNTSLDASTGTMQLRGLIDNKVNRFIPGLFVNVRLPITPLKSLLTVPSTSLSYDQTGPYLLTVSPSQDAVLTRVTLGPAELGRQSITKGLLATDRVIIQGLQFVSPGKKVMIEKMNETNL